MAVTPERKAELIAQLEEIIEHRMDKPKVVASDADVVRDAKVKVSKADPNYRESDEGTVLVRRADFVRINMRAWEEQLRLKAEERRHRREIDPARLGHWNDPD